MMRIVYNIIIYFTLAYSLYYLIMGLFAFIKRKEIKRSDKTNYFSILIAARNEEKVIGELLKSLKNQNYDKNHYEINVIINNCTDNTMNIAINNGANIIECDNPIKCKADALKVAFESLRNRHDIDAYLIFDADNVVHKDFLLHMNDSYNLGFQVAQGTRETKNLGQSWISSSYAIYYYLQNFFFSRARKNLGLSTSINGTGFMVKKELIDSLGFTTKTLTEDIEFSGICILNNIKIDYVEKAITYDEQPTSFSVSWQQRMRWTKGTMQCLRRYGFKLIKKIPKSLSNIDILFLYISPFVQIFSFFAISLNVIVNIMRIENINFSYIISTIPSLLGSYLMMIITSTFVVLYNKHKIKDALSGILLFVLFVFTWLPISIVCIFKRNIIWIPIKHDSNISIDEALKK